jgi:hypothetical protein
MSAYLRRNSRPEYRRDYDEHEGGGGWDTQRERDRGRRQGELPLDRSNEPTPNPTRASQRSCSPRRPRSRQDLPSRNTRPVSPPSLGPRTPVSAEPRSPLSLQLKLAYANAESLSDSRTSIPVTARHGTRDPRLLKRINTSGTIRAGNIAGAAVAESPGLPASANDGTGDQNDILASCSANPNSWRAPSMREQNPITSMPRKTVEQQASSANSLVTLLESLFENASTSAAFKYEHSKVKAKATHQANIDRKMGDLSKTFPAFAETSSKARKDTEKDLAALDEKLAAHQKSQTDLLSSMPNLLEASMTSATTKKEREQMELVQRCLSVYDDFKANVDDLRQRFEKHKYVASKTEENYQTMGRKIDSSTGQVIDLSSQLESVQARCSKLEEKNNEVQDVLKSLSGETRSSLTALEICLKQCTEQGQQQKHMTDTAADKVEQVSQRLVLLEMQNQSFATAKSIHARKADEVEKTAVDILRELRSRKVTASCTEDLVDTVKLMNEDIQDLRHALSDVQNTEPLTPPDGRDISELREDIAALKSGSLGLKKANIDAQNQGATGKFPSPTSMVGRTPRADDDATINSQTHLTAFDDRLRICVKEVEMIQESLEEKEKEEDRRDEIVAAQVDEVKALVEKSKEEIGSRISNLECDLEKQRLEDRNRAERLQDSLSQLLKAAGQASISRESPPNTPHSAQMHQKAQLQVTTSSSPRPMVPILPPELNRRLESIESFLSAIRQQLQAVSLAYHQLDHRYNNLSTEPVVRAMVHQMQLMYPYASEAQREILNLKRMIEPLGVIPVHMESVKRIVGNHEASFAKMSGFEARIDALEKERTKNDVKQEKLVEHVKEERGKLIEEVQNQKEAANGLTKRFEQLEDYRKGEPDRLEYLTQHVAKKLEIESMKSMEDLTRRLEVLEAERKRQDLLGAFTGRFRANKTTENLRGLDDDDTDDTDDSSAPLAGKANGSKSSEVSQSSTPSGTCKTLPKSKTVSNLKKRKRYGNQEKNDRSDDDTYTPVAHSSPTRRKIRG